MTGATRAWGTQGANITSPLILNFQLQSWEKVKPLLFNSHSLLHLLWHFHKLIQYQVQNFINVLAMVYILRLNSNFKTKANSCFLLASSPAFRQHIHSTLTKFSVWSTLFLIVFSTQASSTITLCFQNFFRCFQRETEEWGVKDY